MSICVIKRKFPKLALATLFRTVSWEMGDAKALAFECHQGVCAVNVRAKLLDLTSEEKIERGLLYTPAEIAQPNAKPFLPATLFNTCVFGNNTFGGTFGNAGRLIIKGQGYKTWDTSRVKQSPISEQKHFEFRAEVFNLPNHVNYLFPQLGSISAEPTPLELNPTVPAGQSSFGFPVAARAPRKVQFAVKFYF